MFLSVLSVLLWKNFKRVLYFKKTFLFILAASIGLPYLCARFSYVDPNQNHGSDDLTSFHQQSEYDLLQQRHNTDVNRIVYTPNSSFYTKIMKGAGDKLNIFHENLIGYDNLNDLEAHENFTQYRSQTTVVIFNNPEVKIPQKLHYIVRQQSNIIKPDVMYCNSLRESRYGSPFITFIPIEIAIEKSFMELLVNKKLPSLSSLQNPIKSNGSPNDSVVIQLFRVVVSVSYVMLTVSLLLNAMVEEKQDGIKEILSIATSYSYLNQVALFLLIFLIALLSIIGQCGSALYYNILGCTNIIFMFILMVLFVCALMSYTFFVSTFFESVSFASTIGSTFYVIPYMIFDLATNPVVLWFRWVSPIKLFWDGMEIFVKFKNAERCFTFNDLLVRRHPVNGYSMLDTYLIFVGISCLYLFLYYYISNVFPGKTGTPRSIAFLCMPSFWRSKMPEIFNVNDFNRSNSVICKVHQLSKSFKKTIFSEPLMAVRNVSFEIPKNRVTILLGHNGAGKTTTMSMITGIVPPSSGSISVDNEYDVNVYRSCIGYCPQHDVFISYLNCREHLLLFGRLRGLTKAQAAEETNTILEKVRLTSKANNSATTLSHGMKRRLCLGCAIIGETKLIILDEPSTGLDPESRRDLWDVILPLRKERSLLLTTHSMEEADILGDKIIIMDHGNIVCEGTQLSLKRRYGSGYRLKILMIENFDKNGTLNLITKNINGATIKSETHPTLMISLPYDDISKYSKTLKELEDRKNELGIESISLSHSTMEEVFLNSAATVIDPMAQTDSFERNSNMRYVRLENQGLPERTKFPLFSQFLAICYKKSIFIKRSWIKYLIHFLIPILFVLLMFWVELYIKNHPINNIEHYEQFEINANKLYSPDVILVINQTNHLHRDIAQKFKKLAEESQLNPVVVYNNKMISTLRDWMINDPIHYNERIIGAIEVDDFNSKLDIGYQNNIVISQPFMINFANNLILRMFDFPNRLIVSVHPAATVYTTVNSSVDDGDLFVMLLPNLLPIGLYFYLLVYIALPHIEEVAEFRIIQRISPWLFWVSTYLFDIVCHTLLSTVLIILISLCDANLLERHILINMYLTILVIGYVYIVLLYIYAKLFKKLSTIYTILFYGGFVCWIISFLFLSEKAIAEYPKTYFVFQFHPEFAIRVQLVLAIIGYDQKRQDFRIGRLLGVYLGESLVLLLIIICIFENIYVHTAIVNFIAQINPIRCIRKARGKLPEVDTQPLLPPDRYVEEEKVFVNMAISAHDQKSYALIASQLRKNYIDFPAVKEVNFSVQKGECFGLLGMNGAGKTTIFKMMTLNTSITGGDIYINGFHVKKQRNRYQQEFGYCPEVNALIGCMTSFELLKYMALLKGTRLAHVNSEVDEWITKMDLNKFSHQPSGSYSGGTKRKLLTAISMISNPNLLFLDEPTSGVDPVSRRFMWKCIRDFQKNQQTVILTSHSMDECEELCNRLAIMVRGDFKCIGNIQKLKMIFGTGFTLLVKVRETSPSDDIEKIKAEISGLFECSLRDDHASTLAYNVVEKNIQWSSIFGKVYSFSQKNSDVVEDFAINEISLEDIFLQFRTMRTDPATGTVVDVELTNF